jgi:hypothetical protein
MPDGFRAKEMRIREENLPLPLYHMQGGVS